MPSVRVDEVTYGQGRTVTVGATAVQNATALPAGRYMFRVTGAAINIRQTSGSTTNAATTSEMYIENGDVFFVNVPDGVTSLSYISMIRNGGTSATVYVIGCDERTSQTQPPSWA